MAVKEIASTLSGGIGDGETCGQLVEKVQIAVDVAHGSAKGIVEGNPVYDPAVFPEPLQCGTIKSVEPVDCGPNGRVGPEDTGEKDIITLLRASSAYFV